MIPDLCPGWTGELHFMRKSSFFAENQAQGGNLLCHIRTSLKGEGARLGLCPCCELPAIQVSGNRGHRALKGAEAVDAYMEPNPEQVLITCGLLPPEMRPRGERREMRLLSRVAIKVFQTREIKTIGDYGLIVLKAGRPKVRCQQRHVTLQVLANIFHYVFPTCENHDCS